MNRQVLVVGVGALGSHVVQLLRGVPDITIRVVDHDRVESKNVLSQFHAKASVAKSKVVGLAQTMNFLFGVKIETIPHRLEHDNAIELLQPAALVLDCLDNGASRRLLQKTVRTLCKPCLHGALAADGGLGRVVWDEQFVVDDEDSLGAPTCQAGEHLPFIGVVSAWMAHAAKLYLTSSRMINLHIFESGAIQI